MSADFVPFLQGLRTRLPQAAPAQEGAFTPLTQPPSPAPDHPAHSSSCPEVKVEFKKDGDRIQEIRIHCKCGEVIELLCEY